MADLSQLRVSLLAGTLGQGGAERQLFYIVKALRHAGAGVRVLSLTKAEFWEPRFAELGVPVTWVGRRRSRWGRLASIVAELRRAAPHVVQSQHFFANLYTAVAARICGLKEIGAIRNTIEYEFHGVGALGGNACLRWPRLLAANSHAAIESGIAMGVPPSRFFFLPNVVDTDHFFPIPRKEERPLRLLAAGRLVKQKRLDRFLRLLWRLQRQSGARVTGLVVGSGPLEGELRKQAKELELLPDVVEFRAAVSEMKEIYHAADILVVCSDAEGTPNVVLEAMACGLPVVTTRVGGVSEVVRHGETGLLVDPDEEEQLWRSVLLLLEDRQLSRDMGERARESIVGCASLRRLPQILAELYRMVIP